jgi:hypothetical protein
MRNRNKDKEVTAMSKKVVDPVCGMEIIGGGKARIGVRHLNVPGAKR